MLISIDGPEGAGKSTQVALLAHRLNAIRIREPGGTILGEQLRALLLNPESIIDVHAEVMMFMASRAQMHVEKITPLLKEGKTVILDRWAWSTYAYQHGLTLKDFDWLTTFACSHWPSKSFILDVPVSLGMARLNKKEEHSFGGGKDRFEQRPASFHEKVRLRYEQLTYHYPDRTKLINGSQLPELVHQEIYEDCTRR
jgi:dTMP kinase